jgi:hypothetical protein
VTEVVLPSTKNMEISKLITNDILHYVTSRLVTLLKLIYSSTKVSDVLVLTVHWKFINFVFKIFLLFIPEMPAGFTYCSDYPHLFHLDPVTTAVWPASLYLIILDILCQTTTYASSINNHLLFLPQIFILCLFPKL